MDAENSGAARSGLLDSVPSSDRGLAAQILAACPTVDVVAGEPYFRSSLPAGTLLIVERGFVVFRAAPSRANRSIITCDAGPGRVVLPLASEEVLVALVDSKLTVISPGALDALLALPGMAKTLLEQLARALGQKQEAIGNFASTRHVERVRRRLLQLARNYGRVARDGVWIDFPLSHTLLADMVGSSRETVTRSLDELRRDGFVARQGHNYRLLVSPDCVASATRALAGGVRRRGPDMSNCDRDHMRTSSRVLGSSGLRRKAASWTGSGEHSAGRRCSSRAGWNPTADGSA